MAMSCLNEIFKTLVWEQNTAIKLDIKTFFMAAKSNPRKIVENHVNNLKYNLVLCLGFLIFKNQNLVQGKVKTQSLSISLTMDNQLKECYLLNRLPTTKFKLPIKIAPTQSKGYHPTLQLSTNINATTQKNYYPTQKPSQDTFNFTY